MTKRYGTGKEKKGTSPILGNWAKDKKDIDPASLISAVEEYRKKPWLKPKK